MAHTVRVAAAVSEYATCYVDSFAWCSVAHVIASLLSLSLSCSLAFGELLERL